VRGERVFDDAREAESFCELLRGDNGRRKNAAREEWRKGVTGTLSFEAILRRAWPVP
jgi:hypothetical protein